jgi:hypothetical protein
LWSVARYDLGLSSEEFFSLTPRQLDALIRRHERASKEREFLFAQLTQSVVNFSPVHPKEPAKLQAFMPSEWVKPTAAVLADPTEDERRLIANQMRGIMHTLMKRNEERKQA